MEQEQEKRTEQDKSTLHQIIDLLESHGYWVWSGSTVDRSLGLIGLSVSPKRKN